LETYIKLLQYAIPGFLVLILMEYVIGRWMGKITIRSLDTISSLSSGLTNIIKDVLGLTIVIISYGFLVDHLAIITIESTFLLYVLAFIGLDFVGYWSHRFEHVINVFWNRHIIHHSSEEFNLACALRQNVSVIFAIFFFLYIPMALLGVPQEVVAVVAPIHLFAQFWYHTTLIDKMGVLEYIIVTPSHHRVHHAINDEYIDKNFSQIFIFWDRLFGTFQQELAAVPAVYGTKKPVETWNPFLINFMHFWQLLKDAFRTRNWRDKFKIWFMPTGWRPTDVRTDYPITITEDPYARSKYDTNASLSFIVWHWFQLIITTAFTLNLFSCVLTHTFVEVLLYALFVGCTIFSYTTLMDKRKWAILTEVIKLGICFLIVVLTQGWFGLSEYLPYGAIWVIVYCVVSLVMTIYFLWTESDLRLPSAYKAKVDF